MVQQSKTMRQAQIRRTVQFLAAILIGACVIAIIVFGPQMLGQKNVTADSKTTVTDNRVDNSKPVEKISDFERAVRSQNPRKIRKHYEKIKAKDSGPAIVRLDRLARRLELINLLYQLTTDEANDLFCIEAKLDIFSTRETIAIQFDLFHDINNDELHSYAESAEVAFPIRSVIARSLAKISRFIAEKEIEARAKLRREAFVFFDSIARSNASNQEVSRELATQLLAIIDYGIAPESSPFIHSFLSHFSGIDDAETKTAAKRFQKALAAEVQGLPDIVNALPGFRDREVRSLAIKVDLLISDSNSNVDQPTVDMIFARIIDLLKIGRIRLASNIARKLRRHSDASFSSELEAISNIASTTLDISGFQHSDGNPVRKYRRGNRNKILLFVSNQTQKESLARLRELRKSVGSQNRNVAFSMVFVGELNDGNQKLSFQRFATQNRIDFMVLPTTVAEDKKIAGFVALDSLPLVVLLDKDSQFLALNPPPETIVEILERKISQEKDM